MKMRELTREETRNHIRRLKKIRDKYERAVYRHTLGEIDSRKLVQIKAACFQEEYKYISQSGVIKYFDKLFIKENV